MRRIFQLSTLGILAGVASACNPDRVVATQSPPFASVRFINAVPDTGAAFGLDFRFVDIVENSDAFRITFREHAVRVRRSRRRSADPVQAGASTGRAISASFSATRCSP